jgi:hypothetical protein
MSEEITPEESSFINAKRGFELFGAPLAPYSASRKVAATRMGMTWPFIGEAALAQLQATNMYPDAMFHSVIVLWLCTLPDASTALARGVWTPSRAVSKPDEARDAAIAWADSEGITDMSGPKFGEAFQVFFGIVTGVDAAQFRIEVEKTGGGESGDEPGKV